MQTDPQIIQCFLSDTRNCAMQMMQNAAYILKELPTIEMAEPIRKQITDFCKELIGTKHDLFGEIHRVVDSLEQEHPDENGIDSALALMQRRMSESIIHVNECVTAVKEAISCDSAPPSLGMLVMESAVNILNAVPALPANEEESKEHEPGEDFDDADEECQEDNPDCFAFHCEDAWPIGEITKATRGLGGRTDLDAETRQSLRAFLFAMTRLPFITPGVSMSLRLRRECGEDADWIEIRMQGDEFALGRGTWEDGDANTETDFEVTPHYRVGDAFIASHFAASFSACAEDVCRELVIEDHSDEPFTGWDLKPDKTRWASLPCAFL